MKVNIHKFQTGGGFAQFTPILRSPLKQGESSGQENTRESSKSSGLLDEDIYKDLIKDGGLTNDVNALVDQLVKLEEQGFNDPNNSTKALRLFAKINELKNNKDNWKDAVTTAKESGGLGEIAVNNFGEVYVKNEKGKISTLHLSQYKKEKEKYHTLSVSELLNARQNDPQLTFDTSVFSVAENSIGIEKINNHLKSIITSFGTESLSTERHYTKDQVISEISRINGLKKPSANELKSLETLYELANTPGDYLKVVEKDSGKRKQLQQGLNYLISTLPKEYQLKLEAVAIQNGRESGKDYIVDMLSLLTPQETTSNITPSKEPGGSEGSGSGSNKENELTRFQLFHKDKLIGAYSNFSFNDPKLNVMFQGTIGAIAPIVDKKDNNVGMTTLSDILFNKEYNALVNSNQVYFGTEEVGDENLNNIIYDGKDAAKIYMPVGYNGAPDFEANEKFKEIYTVYEANKNNWSTKEAEDFFKKNNYNLKIKEDFSGEKVILDNQWVKPFLVMHAYTNSATDLITDKNKDFVKKLSSAEEANILPVLEQVWTIGSGKNIKNLTPDKSWHLEKYYKGIVTIPYKKESTAIVDAMVGQGPKEKPTSLLDVQKNIKNSSNIPIIHTDARVLTQ